MRGSNLNVNVLLKYCNIKYQTRLIDSEQNLKSQVKDYSQDVHFRPIFRQILQASVDNTPQNISQLTLPERLTFLRAPQPNSKIFSVPVALQSRVSKEKKRISLKDQFIYDNTQAKHIILCSKSLAVVQNLRSTIWLSKSWLVVLITNQRMIGLSKINQSNSVEVVGQYVIGLQIHMCNLVLCQTSQSLHNRKDEVYLCCQTDRVPVEYSKLCESWKGQELHEQIFTEDVGLIRRFIVLVDQQGVRISHFPYDMLLVIYIFEISHSIFQSRLFFYQQLLPVNIPLVVVFWITIVAECSRTNVPKFSICQEHITQVSKRHHSYILSIFDENRCLHNVDHVVSILILKIKVES